MSSNILEIAKMAGVSMSTVSRTFNSPHMINGETRKRVLDAAHRLHYSPPRQRAGRTANDLGVDFHFFAENAKDSLQSNPFYSTVFAGAMAEATDLGMQLTLSSSSRHDDGTSLPPAILDGRATGLLLVGDADIQVHERYLAGCDTVVFVDTRDPTGRHDAIVTDNIGGCEIAVNYLISLGHRRIGFVTGGHTVVSFRERLVGYMSAHHWAGISYDPTSIVFKDAELLRECLSKPDRPTAFMCANDDCAFNLMQVCYDLNLKIPTDISMVGFDDVDISSRTTPPLTSVHVSAELLGRLAVRRIQSLLCTNPRPPLTLPSTSLLPVRLVERQSCR